MAYSTTKYSAQFALRVIGNIQTYLEASLTTALTELDATLTAFADYRTPTQIALNFPALFLAPAGAQLAQSDDDSYVESSSTFFVDLAIVGVDSYTLSRSILKYLLAVDRVLRTATNTDIEGSTSSSLTKAVWEPTEWQISSIRTNDTIYRIDARLVFVVQLLER